MSEVYPGRYAIVNHTRNTKGYIDLKEQKGSDIELSVGQLVIASVQSVGTASYQAETSGHKNRKLQLSLDPKLLNRGITSETVTTAMVMQGLVESKESKGFIIDLGLKDKSKGFVKFSKVNDDDDVKVGSLVQVIVLGKTSKVIRCQFLTHLHVADENAAKLQQVKTDLATVTPHTLKPGFSVSAKVQKLFTNGIEVSFLGGMTGTIFADHIVKANPSKYKVGEKVTAVVISQDISSKATALTLKPSLLKLEA